jgi:hypothetical protein
VKEIRQETLAQVCELLDIDPHTTKAFTVALPSPGGWGGVEITTTEQRIFTTAAAPSDPF